jgi:hypothetical protein
MQMFCRTLMANQCRQLPSIVLHGEWQARRFVVGKIGAGENVVTAAVPDAKGLTLTLPIVDDWSFYVRECASFGASIASLYRKRKVFEIVSGHIVAEFHHVALCGFRGPWIDGENAAQTCPTCAKIAETRPNFRARYHPLACA